MSIKYFVKNYIEFIKSYYLFKRLSDNRFTVNLKDYATNFTDKTETTNFDRHYIYFPAWAVRKILEYKPTKHVDIGSSLTFSSIVSSFVKIDFYDYRPANIQLSGLKSLQANLIKLKFRKNSVASLSCMHVIEHIGLGRYGDLIDPTADIQAANELARVLSIGGNLLIVVPVGKPKIVFNSHRIYTYQMITKMFKELTLKEFSLIRGSGHTGLIKNPAISSVQKEDYGCGCFWFTKEK